MKRLGVVGLVLVGALAAGGAAPTGATGAGESIAATSAPEAIAVDVQSVTARELTKTAATPVQAEAYAPEKVGAFATVYQQKDGKRFAVLDYRAEGAPKGERILSGAWLKEYDLAYIDAIRPAAALPLKEVPVPAPRESEADKIRASSLPPIDNPWAWPTQLYSRTPAYFNGWRSSYDQRNQYLRSGGFVGCENATNRTRNCTHSSTVSWSWTTGGSSKLSAEKIVELGFEYRQTHSDSDTFTFTDIPPMTGLWDIPYVVSHKRFFNSSEDEYVCGAPEGYRRCWSNTIFNGSYNSLDYWWQFAGFVDRMVERPLGSPPDA